MPQVVSDVKARPAVRQLIQSRGLNDDDITMLVAIKIEHPYPVSRWMNGFLYSNCRDLDVVNCVGPAFTMLHRAMLKLPQVKVNANRGAVVNGVPSLKSIYDGYEERLPPKSKLSFWGTSSFTTSSKVLSSQYFIGGHGVEAIVYSCGQLTGVDMEPFCPPGMASECEVLPLCPAMFEVTGTVKIDKRVIISLAQVNSSDFAYVKPQ
jgi:hypothetical protein